MIEILKSKENLWELFTKKEEYMPLILDKYQRFSYYSSNNRNVLEPKASAFLIQNGFLVEYPNNKNFAVVLTHDIDVIYLRRAYEIARSLGKLKISEALKILLSKTKKKLNHLWNFEQIMNIEKKYKARSSFYFLTLDKSDLDFNFRIEDLNDELKNIVDNGCEVGLHGGHEAYTNLNKIRAEKERLEKVIEKEVIGYRNHFLRFKIPTTWELLKKAGFKYDTTFGYADCVGFRNGMCHPFKPFNLNTSKFINILEIPLTIMDRTLLDNYMRLDMKNAWNLTKLLIDTVERYKGVITILWHNTYMFDEMLELYKKILGYCHMKNAWMTSGAEIWKWWHKNHFLEG